MRAGRLFGLVLVASAGSALAQQAVAPAALGRAAPAPARVPDAAETPMLEQPATEGSLLGWYRNHQRPGVVVYFEKKLDQLPRGWEGRSRLLIEDQVQVGQQAGSRKLSVGMQYNTAVAAPPRSDLDKLFEHALARALKQQEIRVMDGTTLHRRQAAQAKGAGGDLEYDGLQASARFVFEVELVALQETVYLVGTLKDIRSGDLTGTVRLELDGALNDASDVERTCRQLVQRLLRERA